MKNYSQFFSPSEIFSLESIALKLKVIYFFVAVPVMLLFSSQVVSNSLQPRGL